jgi:hypothetical protein
MSVAYGSYWNWEIQIGKKLCEKNQNDREIPSQNILKFIFQANQRKVFISFYTSSCSNHEFSFKNQGKLVI